MYDLRFHWSFDIWKSARSVQELKKKKKNSTVQVDIQISVEFKLSDVPLTLQLLFLKLQASLLKLPIREFKNRRWLRQRKHQFEIELCVRLSVSRLFHVDHVEQNRRSALSLAWHERLSRQGKEKKIYCSGLALPSEPHL